MTRADLRAQMRCTCFNCNEKKRVKGIEPSCAAWEAAILPLNYTRDGIADCRFQNFNCNRNQTHCHEITSSEALKFVPCTRSFPSDHAITPFCKFGVAPAFDVY